MMLRREENEEQEESSEGRRLNLNLTLGSSTSIDHSNRPSSHKSKSSSIILRKIYSCNFCSRKFTSSQALGGHQNAHKREREITTRRSSHQYYSTTKPPAVAAATFLNGLPSTIDTIIIRAMGSTHHHHHHHNSSHVLQNHSSRLEGRMNKAKAKVVGGLEGEFCGIVKAHLRYENTMLWPGSFHLDNKQVVVSTTSNDQLSSSHYDDEQLGYKVDLNLKL